MSLDLTPRMYHYLSDPLSPTIAQEQKFRVFRGEIPFTNGRLSGPPTFFPTTFFPPTFFFFFFPDFGGVSEEAAPDPRSPPSTGALGEGWIAEEPTGF